tara:strand:- start:763 stop:891 length:129 start_codon:yes stop_codon:yes gene_type:complete
MRLLAYLGFAAVIGFTGCDVAETSLVSSLLQHEAKIASALAQ